MNIELLWILPIIGFGVFVSLTVFLIHSKYSGSGQELNRRVKQFNSGVHYVPQSTERAGAQLESRLFDLENAIASLTKSISAHQKSAETQAPAGSAAQQNELRNMLDNLYREYGVILSENNALRDRLGVPAGSGNPANPPHQNPKVNLRIFDDTRYLNTDNFDDTAEFDTLAAGDK
ncbi:MAG: hypothetical protein LBB56_01420 [Chitinispirillales bacterium]|jgi:hypothetical protein|nr:hypothetical protein [Chitinispirillales bacterium]